MTKKKKFDWIEYIDNLANRSLDEEILTDYYSKIISEMENAPDLDEMQKNNWISSIKKLAGEKHVEKE